MANSNRINNCVAVVMMIGSLTHATMSHGAAVKKSTATINVESDGAAVDARTKLLVLPKVRISQEDYVIQADEARATGLDFQNSKWIFSGKVIITTADGSSTADRATVLFVQNQISELHAIGQPATFEQHDENKQTLAQGHAGFIDYDLHKNTVKLTQQAWVKYGQNEFKGTTVVYDIANQRVLADQAEQQGERVHITINPNTNTTTTKMVPKSKTEGRAP